MTCKQDALFVVCISLSLSLYICIYKHVLPHKHTYMFLASRTMPPTVRDLAAQNLAQKSHLAPQSDISHTAHLESQRSRICNHGGHFVPQKKTRYAAKSPLALEIKVLATLLCWYHRPTMLGSLVLNEDTRAP